MAINESITGGLSPPPGFSEFMPWLTQSVLPYTSYYLFDVLFPRVWDLIWTPLVEREMLWVVVPLVATLVAMTIYFGAHKSEDMGWNTAFGNSLVLIFTAFNLLQLIYGDINLAHLTFNEDTLIALILLGEGALLMFINFFHFLPARMMFALSSPTNINMFAIFGVIIVYSTTIPLNLTTVLAMFIIYLLALLGLWMLKIILPSSRARIDRITQANYFDVPQMQAIKK